jgi:hypothetical protein
MSDVIEIPYELAIHEAAHAVIGRLLGVELSPVTFDVEDVGHGYIVHGETVGIFDPEKRIEHGAISAAGPLADSILSGDFDFDLNGTTDDHDEMRKFLTREEAVETVQVVYELLAAHWPEVEAEADRLVKEGGNVDG